VSHSVVNNEDGRTTPPSRRSTPNSGQVTRNDVIDLAHRWFLEGRRVDAQQLARELGIGRATLYRWWTSRDVVIGEVIWRIFLDAIARVELRSTGSPSARFVANFGRVADTVRTYKPLASFVADDPEYALRVVTSRHSIVQQRLTAWTATQLREIPEVAAREDIDDLAYTLVRVAESFLWSDMINGDPPHPDKATAMVGLLISGAVANSPATQNT
jgi:AcrR family transcriptional regulator